MDNELLFILIVILTVVINIIGAIRKKKQGSVQVPQYEEEEPAEENWQDILQKMLGESEKQTEKAGEVYEEAESLETLTPLGGSIGDPARYTFKEPEYTKSSFTMEGFDVNPAIDEESVQTQSFPGDYSSYINATVSGKEFDLKEAVIYNAILERPYS